MTPRVLIDVGALVSVVDHSQPRSLTCRALVTALPLPLVTTWAAYTEAMYLLFGPCSAIFGAMSRPASYSCIPPTERNPAG